MSAIKGRAIIAQSGGPTAVINASAAGVIQTVLANPAVFTGVYGANNGILGVLQRGAVRPGPRGPRHHRRACGGPPRPPWAVAGTSSRTWPRTAPITSESWRSSSAHDIRYFFYAGGNDSMDTADKVARLAAESDYEMVVMGVPKTIDNDLAYTDHCPGYGSVAKFNATTVMEAGRDTEACTPPTPAPSRRSWAATPAGSPPPPGWPAARSRTPRT